jgi:hypothetical protein
VNIHCYFQFLLQHVGTADVLKNDVNKRGACWESSSYETDTEGAKPSHSNESVAIPLNTCSRNTKYFLTAMQQSWLLSGV